MTHQEYTKPSVTVLGEVTDLTLGHGKGKEYFDYTQPCEADKTKPGTPGNPFPTS